MEITNRNASTIKKCAILFFGFVVLNFFVIDKINSDTARNFLSILSSTIATVLLANVLWEVIAKENFAKSLLNQVKISENIAQSGIDSVYVDFRDIDWKKEFENTKSFTAAFVYAYSWRSHNENAIKAFFAKKSHKKNTRIIVPDPENEDIMSDLDRRFNFENGETRKRIEDCIKFYCDLGISVYLFEGTLQASYYLMDKAGIMSFFTHSKEKGVVPALKAHKSGNMYKYISQDISSMLSRSCKVKRINIEIIDGVRKVTVWKEEQ